MFIELGQGQTLYLPLVEVVEKIYDDGLEVDLYLFFFVPGFEADHSYELELQGGDGDGEEDDIPRDDLLLGGQQV